MHLLEGTADGAVRVRLQPYFITVVAGAILATIAICWSMMYSTYTSELRLSGRVTDLSGGRVTVRAPYRREASVILNSAHGSIYAPPGPICQITDTSGRSVQDEGSTDGKSKQLLISLGVESHCMLDKGDKVDMKFSSQEKRGIRMLIGI